MTLLLDTHVLLQSEARVLFSAASVWEIAVKCALGRADFAFEPDAIVQAAIDTAFEPWPVHHDHAKRVRRLPPVHAGPFDRMLIAQAQCEGAQLVTADRVLMDYPAPIRWYRDF